VKAGQSQVLLILFPPQVKHLSALSMQVLHFEEHEGHISTDKLKVPSGQSQLAVPGT